MMTSVDRRVNAIGYNVVFMLYFICFIFYNCFVCFLNTTHINVRVRACACMCVLFCSHTMVDHMQHLHAMCEGDH